MVFAKKVFGLDLIIKKIENKKICNQLLKSNKNLDLIIVNRVNKISDILNISSCLIKSFACSLVFKSYGLNCQLVIGVATDKKDNKMYSHAWIESNRNKIFKGNKSINKFKEIKRIFI